MKELTAQELKAAVQGSTYANAERYVKGINAAIKKFGINTPLRLAHFLAQIGHESISLAATRESLDYTVERLLKTFGRRRISEADAHKFGRTPTRPAHQNALANIVYGGEWGKKNLGNTQPGDGWKYRGGGACQTTGRANYTATGKALGLDLVTNPELLSLPENFGLSAGHFWHSRNLNAVADLDNGTEKSSAATVVVITRLINGGSNGLADRQARFVHARAALGIPAPLKTPAVVTK